MDQSWNTHENENITSTNIRHDIEHTGISQFLASNSEISDQIGSGLTWSTNEDINMSTSQNQGNI